MSTMNGSSAKRIPGKMKSKTKIINPYQQLLSVAEKIIQASAEPSIVKKYFRLRQKLLGCQSTTPALSIQATPQKLSNTLKQSSKSKNITTVKKRQIHNSTVNGNHSDGIQKKTRSKSTQLLHSRQDQKENMNHKATRSKSRIKQGFVIELCDAVCSDLNLLREKILRKEYSRKKLKHIQPQMKRTLCHSKTVNENINAKFEAYEVAFDKVTLALDVVSMQAKEDLSKAVPNTGPPEGQRIKQDNAWLLDKVQKLLNQNYQLRTRLIGSDVTAACQEVRNEIAQKSG